MLLCLYPFLFAIRGSDALLTGTSRQRVITSEREGVIDPSSPAGFEPNADGPGYACTHANGHGSDYTLHSARAQKETIRCLLTRASQLYIPSVRWNIESSDVEAWLPLHLISKECAHSITPGRINSFLESIGIAAT